MAARMVTQDRPLTRRDPKAPHRPEWTPNTRPCSFSKKEPHARSTMPKVLHYQNNTTKLYTTTNNLYHGGYSGPITSTSKSPERSNWIRCLSCCRRSWVKLASKSERAPVQSPPTKDSPRTVQGQSKDRSTRDEGRVRGATFWGLISNKARSRVLGSAAPPPRSKKAFRRPPTCLAAASSPSALPASRGPAQGCFSAAPSRSRPRPPLAGLAASPTPSGRSPLAGLRSPHQARRGRRA